MNITSIGREDPNTGLGLDEALKNKFCPHLLDVCLISFM